MVDRDMAFVDYFSFESILNDLIRRRIRGRDVGGMLPARKAWSRLDVKEREKMSPDRIRRISIWRTVMRCYRDGSIMEYRWGRRLVEFVTEVQALVQNGTITFDPPRMIEIYKGNVNGRPEYRTVASFERMVDSVVLSCVTAYVRDVLEGVLTEACYSFRKDFHINHQLAVTKLQEWRSAHAHEAMYVAECDIQKFFDNISHTVVRNCWNRIGFDAAASNIFNAYLAVYSSSREERRGLPQGGAFSTVLANMVLMSADQAVRGLGYEDLFMRDFVMM